METKPVATMTAEDWNRIADDLRSVNQETIDAVQDAFQQIGVAAREAAYAFEEAARTFFSYLHEHHPDAFHADGTLRGDWLEIVGRDECGAQDA